VRRHFELPDVHADASEASMRPWVLGRSGLDGDEVASMARVIAEEENGNGAAGGE